MRIGFSQDLAQLREAIFRFHVLLRAKDEDEAGVGDSGLACRRDQSSWDELLDVEPALVHLLGGTSLGVVGSSVGRNRVPTDRNCVPKQVLSVHQVGRSAGATVCARKLRWLRW